MRNLLHRERLVILTVEVNRSWSSCAIVATFDGRLITDITGVMSLSDGVTKADMSVRQPHLVLRSQKGFANELLPLGISLEDASGGETVSMTGLASAGLSKGTSLGLAGWQVSAEDLDNTWVSAPEGFVGVMDAMVNLHSTSGQLLQSKILRLEWIAKEEKEEGLAQARGTLEPVPELRPLEPPLCRSHCSRSVSE